MAGTVHPGADDNASGTAGVIELAHWFSREPKHQRGILFLTFAGEELGLLGSSYYVNHPESAAPDAVAMINMDMIGRIRDRKVYVGGVGTRHHFRRAAQAARAQARFRSRHHRARRLRLQRSYFVHHQTSPRALLLLRAPRRLSQAQRHLGQDRCTRRRSLARSVADVMDHLTDTSPRPQFVRVAETIDPQEVAKPALGKVSGGGYGPDFGSIPDFTEIPNGVSFADIRPGSPAAKAGLKAGDILTEFDGKPIQNLYDFTYALRARKPGQEVLVKVLRGDQTIDSQGTTDRTQVRPHTGSDMAPRIILWNRAGPGTRRSLHASSTDSPSFRGRRRSRKIGRKLARQLEAARLLPPGESSREDLDRALLDGRYRRTAHALLRRQGPGALDRPMP